MASPYTLQRSSACGSQSVATPVARRDLHALRNGQDSLDSSPRCPLAWSPPASYAAGATAPTSSSGCTDSVAPELTCQEQLEGRCSPERGAAEALAALPRPPSPAACLREANRSAQAPPLQPFCTPKAAMYQFGSPLCSPARPSSLSPPGAHLAGGSPLATPQPPLSLSGAAAAPPSPPLVTLSPRILHAGLMRPCSVRLTGSVRLCGDRITPIPRTLFSTLSPDKGAAPAGAAAAAPARLGHGPAAAFPLLPEPPRPHRAAPAARTASADSANRQPQAGSWQRELSFADLLTAHRPVAAPLPAAPRPPASPPRAAELVAEMAVTPRKRARKSLAPLRAAACEGEAAQQQAGAAPGPPLHGSCQGESDGDSSGLQEDAALSTPRKLPRRK